MWGSVCVCLPACLSLCLVCVFVSACLPEQRVKASVSGALFPLSRTPAPLTPQQVVQAQAADRAVRLAQTQGANAAPPPQKGPVTAPDTATPQADQPPPVLELLAALVRTCGGQQLNTCWADAALPAWRQLEACGLHPIESNPVAAALRSLVAQTLAPIYATLDPIARLPIHPPIRTRPPAPPPTTKEAESDVMAAPTLLAPLLEKLGPYLADDVVLYVRVLRVLKVSLWGGGRSCVCGNTVCVCL